MEVAVCLTGHMRTYQQTHSRLKELLRSHSVSYFIHTWDVVGNSANWLHPLSSSPLNVSEVIQTYSPKEIVVDSIAPFQAHPEWSSIPNFAWFNPQRVLSQFYKFYSCNQLRKTFEKNNSMKFDVVFRCRPDLVVDAPSLPFQDASDNKIFVPKRYDNDWLHANYGVVNDLFSFGTGDSMDIYCGVFEQFENYRREGMGLLPEHILYTHLQRAGIVISEVPVHTHIIRG